MNTPGGLTVMIRIQEQTLVLIKFKVVHKLKGKGLIFLGLGETVSINLFIYLLKGSVKDRSEMKLQCNKH